MDLRILRELTQAQTVWPARPGLVSSYRLLARRLGVSAGTVRNRIDRMTRCGFLQGTTVYVNPALVGLLSGSYAVEVSPTLPKSKVLDRLAKVDGVVFFENFHGNLLGIGLTYAGEAALERMLRRIDRIAQAPRGRFSRVLHPPCLLIPTTTEWGLISRLMRGESTTQAQLARELGVSVRTVKRRLARLTASGALLTFPRMDYRALPGGVAAELLIAYSDPPSKSDVQGRILRRLDAWTTYVGVWEEFEAYRLILPNVARAVELAEEIGREDGVGFSRLELVDGLVDRLSTLRSRVDRHLARLPTASSPSRRRSTPAA